jgi:hypothetical protein
MLGSALPPLRRRPRHRPAGAAAFALIAALGLPLGSGPVRAQASDPQGSASQAVAPALDPVAARAAAERILTALRGGDADARYEQFSPDLKRMTSPSMVALTMKEQPRILRTRILSVKPGLTNTLVEASLSTTAGPRDLLMILDAQGLLEGYHIGRADESASTVVRNFMNYLMMGHYISARSFLSPDMQEELSPGVLQSKWQNLQRLTGNVVKVQRIDLAETAANQKLVLVTTEFTRLTDSLFVVLDDNNQIVNIDFPSDPAPPAQAP